MPKPARVGAPTPRSTAKSPTTPAAVKRIQIAVTTQNGRGFPKDSYVTRMQRAVAKAAQ
jgi:hypothetical protein